MPDSSLPAELAEMEDELRQALNTAPSAALRGRVLEAMRVQMRDARRAGRAAWGSFLIGTAAAALLWTNLSMSLVNNTWHAVTAPAPRDIEETAARMRKLLPELTPAQARHQAAMALARTTLAPAGALPVPVFARDEPWDTP